MIFKLEDFLNYKETGILYWLFLMTTLLFVISLPYTTLLNSVLVIVLVLLKITAFVSFKRIEVSRDNKKVFVSCLLFFTLYSLSLLWSENIHLGTKLLENRLAWIAFPIIFLTTPLTILKKHQHLVLWTFTINILIACMYTHIDVYNDILTRGFPLSKWTSWWYTSMNLSGRIDMHSTYLTVYVSTASIIIIYLLKHAKISATIRAMLVLVIIYLFVYNLLLSSRLNMILHAFIVSYFVADFAKEKIRNNWAFSGLMVVWLIILAATINEMPYLKSKFEQNINFLSNVTDINESKESSTNQHVNSWICSIEQMSFPAVLVGYGLGDADDVLASCYLNKGYTLNYESNYNAHNEFFEIILNIGLLGLLILSLIYIYSVKKKSFVLNWFLTIMGVAFLSESMLSRQKGVVLFVFFICYLNIIERIKENKTSRKNLFNG